MLRRVTAAALLAGLMTLAAHAQSAPQQPRRFHLPPVDLAVTYDAERGKIAASNCGCFWFQGGGVNSSITAWALPQISVEAAPQKLAPVSA